jgi:hypothetical protein
MGSVVAVADFVHAAGLFGANKKPGDLKSPGSFIRSD